jgi:serine/threonine protein kinase
MGIVYRATRDDDEYKKDVAIKAVGLGLFAPELRWRFLAERQILANLDHPSIARLLDGGTTADGLPYVVMEYVQGQLIDRYCLEKGLSQRDRLLLAIQVIQAVDYAHRHLVVHRDLKPDNIFVDTDGTPKLLDFGIAKALDPSEDVLSGSITQTVERVMTPDYASPEQILGQSITTSTDVFQLGVLLYVLLTGRLPFRAPNGRAGELERLICEAAPPKTDLPTDLDRIVLQALEKEPRRRYPSAAALGEDLQRYLDGFPVKARTSSWRYSAWRFVQRHKIAVSAASLAVLGLIGVSIAMTVIARRASQQARIADQTTDFLLGIFGANDPVEGRGDKTTARELLDNAAAELQTYPNQDPVVEVQLLDSIGESYRRLGDTEQARELLVKCLVSAKMSYPEIRWQ